MAERIYKGEVVVKISFITRSFRVLEQRESIIRFVEGLKKSFEEVGINIPSEKWFMNLARVGNVGSASIYLALDELMNSGKLKKGNKILLSVPESGRFSYAYAYLTVY